MGKTQIKLAINKFLLEITPTILPTLANLELLKKFLEYKIANLPEAKPIDRMDTNKYPYSTKVNKSPSLVSKPRINAKTPYVPKRLSWIILFILCGDPPAPKPSAESANPSSWNAPVKRMLIIIAIIQDKKIGNPKKINKSPSTPDSSPIRNPTRGKAQAAFVKSGALSEKKDHLMGIRVKNITVAKKSITYLFFISTRIIKFFC